MDGNEKIELDSSSEEGAIMANMFRSSSTSSHSSTRSSYDVMIDTNDGSCDIKEANNDTTALDDLFNNVQDKEISFHRSSVQLDDDKAHFTSIYVDGIHLVQKSFGGKIAQRLWPAASYLSTFILNFINVINSQNMDMMDTKIDNCCLEDGTRTKIPKNTSFHEKSKIRKKKAQENLKNIFLVQKNSNHPFSILELGAGIGLTGIKIATKINAKVILTDLPLALPILQRNIQLNEHKFIYQEKKAVTAEALNWGSNEWKSVLSKFDKFLLDHHLLNNDINDPKSRHYFDLKMKKPILILASDCVYFKDLHLPLEETLKDILSNSHETSMCLIAAARRFKSDNTFFKNLGKKTRTASHSLHSICVDECVERCSDELNGDLRNTMKRNVMRVYAIQWLPHTNKM